MFLLFGGQLQVAQACFAVSLILMIVSLLLSLWEIWISVDALNVHLRGIQEGQELSPVSLPWTSRASLSKRKAFEKCFDLCRIAAATSGEIRRLDKDGAWWEYPVQRSLRAEQIKPIV
jgi:hypothetical protein